MITYGSLLLWAIHGFQNKVFQSNYILERISRWGLAITAVLSAIMIFQQISLNMAWEWDGIMESLSAQGDFGPFAAHWFITGIWGLAGIILLLHPSTQEHPVAGQFMVAQPGATPGLLPRDPATVPLPDSSAIRNIFHRKGLSDRESEVAVHLISGACNKEIAQKVGISYNTVKNHVANIFRKLEATNRFELIRNLRDSTLPIEESV